MVFLLIEKFGEVKSSSLPLEIVLSVLKPSAKHPINFMFNVQESTVQSISFADLTVESSLCTEIVGFELGNGILEVMDTVEVMDT